MTLRVATVLSAREWESRLVAASRASATIRLVLRAFQPEEVLDRLGEIDIIVVGAETPWVTPARLASWARSGSRVVGIHPSGDRPAAERLRSGGVDLVLADDLPADTMLREIRLLEPAAAREAAVHGLVAVTGARGAPGRTSVAFGLAWILARRQPVTVVDGDLSAPGLAIRLGVPPRPDVADAVDAVHADGTVPAGLLQSWGRLRILPGSHRPGDPPLRSETLFDVVDALRVESLVVTDLGPWPEGREVLKAASTAVVVIDSSPTGIVRAAALLSQWAGPPPSLIANRIGGSAGSEVVAAIRKWIGIEPSAMIPLSRAISRSARAGDPPARPLLRSLAESSVA